MIEKWHQTFWINVPESNNVSVCILEESRNGLQVDSHN